MGIKIGIAGCGRFSTFFIPLFKNHPLVEKVVIADLLPERAKECALKFGATAVCGGLDELLATDVDCIGVFVQRHLHGPMSIKALEAGRHVYCAVPMASDMEHICTICELTKKTGLIYMTGETSYYYPNTIYCRRRFKAGDMGRFVYAEAQYLHDMKDFYDAYAHSGGAHWKQVAGFPPMYYPTHSVSMVLSVTNARVTRVSCMGFMDDHEDGIFRREANLWGNVFSNETALMKTSDGGCCRINEFRRVAFAERQNGVYASIFGTEGTYEQSSSKAIWMGKKGQQVEDVTAYLNTTSVDNFDISHVQQQGVKGREFFTGVSNVHNVKRLPDSFKNLPNGHWGSHQFLVDDFVKAVASGKLPPNNAWSSASYCAPGLIAHESAKKDGLLMEVPDFGSPPSSWTPLDPDDET